MTNYKYDVNNVDRIIHIYYAYNNHMILDKTLQQLGMSEKQALVYLAALELGKATALSIARKSELKRPSVYVTLEELMHKGFIKRVPKGTTTYYIAEDPTSLLNQIDSQKKQLVNIMPVLKAMHHASAQKPQIKYFEGREGVREAYRAFRKAKKYILFYGSIKHIVKHFPDSFLDAEEIKEMKIDVTEIVSGDPVDIAYANRIQATKNPRHKVRKLKKGTSLILDSVIYDDNILIVSLKGTFFGVLIQSKDIAQSYKILYELAWQAAEPIK